MRTKCKAVFARIILNKYVSNDKSSSKVSWIRDLDIHVYVSCIELFMSSCISLAEARELIDRKRDGVTLRYELPAGEESWIEESTILRDSRRALSCSTSSSSLVASTCGTCRPTATRDAFHCVIDVFIRELRDAEIVVPSET